MDREERALQLWSMLALCARNRQTLTYDMAARLTGLSPEGIDVNLEPLHFYCLQEHLPSLAILVVDPESGFPRSQTLSAEELPAERERVFLQDWLAWPAPSVEELAAAASEMSSDRTSVTPADDDDGGKFMEA